MIGSASKMSRSAPWTAVSNSDRTSRFPSFAILIHPNPFSQAISWSSPRVRFDCVPSAMNRYMCKPVESEPAIQADEDGLITCSYRSKLPMHSSTAARSPPASSIRLSTSGGRSLASTSSRRGACLDGVECTGSSVRSGSVADPVCSISLQPCRCL